jgi:hypothetical protein
LHCLALETDMAIQEAIGEPAWRSPRVEGAAGNRSIPLEGCPHPT